jgi:hypothetical protein
MSGPLVRPSVRNLIFHLYGRPLHPELFDILAVRRLHRPEYQATVYITRTGHVLSWSNHRQCLTEVAGAADDPLPESRRLLHYRLQGGRSGAVQGLPGVSYQMSFQVETLPPEIFAHVHEEILADGRKRGLLHNFPPPHRLALAPLGFVTLEAQTRCLLLSAFHTFPAENAIIKSQSLIEWQT